MWVCEKNLPPAATWLLNYTQVDKEEDLTEDQMEAFRRWDQKNGHLKEEEQQWEQSYTCFKHVKYRDQAVRRKVRWQLDT